MGDEGEASGMFRQLHLSDQVGWGKLLWAEGALHSGAAWPGRGESNPTWDRPRVGTPR